MRKVLTILGPLAFCAITISAHAQFGGGVVFDPAQSTHAVTQIVNEGKSLANQTEQIAQGSQANLTLAQQLSQDLQIAATALKNYMQAVTTYNTIYANLQHFSVKSVWRTLQNQLTLAQIANRYGESAGLEQALGGNPSTAGGAWKAMNVALAATSPSFFSSEIVGASQRLSALAAVEAQDGVSTQCLSAVGAYNSNRLSATTPIAGLQTSQFDIGGGTNSEMEQMDMLNMNSAQHMNEAQGQGQIQACLAAQAAVSNMQSRNAQMQALNDAAYVEQQQAINPTSPNNESGTWQTYLP